MYKADLYLAKFCKVGLELNFSCTGRGVTIVLLVVAHNDSLWHSQKLICCTLNAKLGYSYATKVYFVVKINNP